MAESAQREPGRIFISYRREETAYPAGWLFDRLAKEFSPDQVFKDVDSIALGDDFVEVINKAVGSTDVLLALIGDRWLVITDKQGRRRLDDPDDFVRLEIEAALARKVRVIPILVEGAQMPSADELPPSLAPLSRRQALELSPSRFHSDTSRLLKVLEQTFDELRAAQEPVKAEVRAAPREPPAPARPQPGRSRKPLVAGAAVLALVLIGIVLAVVLRPSPAPPSAKEGTGASGVGASGVGKPPPATQSLALVWKPALSFGGAGHQEVTALTATGKAGGVAVGYQTVSDPTTGQPTNRILAWRSRRGVWRPETVESADRYGELQAVAFDPSSSTVVAAGASGVGHAHSAAAVWTKVGARNWQKACLSDCSAPAGRAEIWGVLALPAGGFVAVGQGDATSPTDFHPTVWTSDNGLSWQPKVLSASEPGAVLWVARTAKGGLVAVGKTGPDQKTTAAVWTSDDGSAWRGVQAPVFAGAKQLHGVAALGNTLLAVGFKKAKTPTGGCGSRRQTALFRSTDGGRTWQARRSSALANAEQWFDVVPYRGQFVALGYEFAGCSRDSVAAAWTSPTGIRWTKQRGSFGVAGSVFGRGAVIGPVFYAAGDGPSSSGATDDAERDAVIWAGRRTRQARR